MAKHKDYILDQNISDNDIVFGSDADDNLKSKNFRIGSIKSYIVQSINNITQPKYKVYTALLTQSGLDAPVAIVLENTIGDIVFTYNGLGAYRAISNGSFIQDKTFVLINGGVNENGSLVELLTINEISIKTTNNVDASNNILNKTSFEIRVYN